jgi:hypothetical protein
MTIYSSVNRGIIWTRGLDARGLDTEEYNVIYSLALYFSFYSSVNRGI